MVITYNPQLHVNKFQFKNENKKVEIFRPKNILPAKFHILQIINPFTLLEWIVLSFSKIKEYNPDFIISTTPTPHPAILSFVCNIFFKTRYCVDIRDNWIGTNNDLAKKVNFLSSNIIKASNLFFKQLFYMSLKKASLISTVNESLKVEFLLNPNTKAVVVPNGINISELNSVKSKIVNEKILQKHKLSIPKDSKIIIYVGDLGAPYYKPEILLKAIKSLNDNNFPTYYIIIGEGSSKNTISMKVKEYGIENYVYLVGKKNHEEVFELLLSSDFAFYTLQHGDIQARHAIGVKIYEYIACELPILAVTDSDSAVSSLLKNNKIGLGVEWSNADKLDTFLLDLMSSNEYQQNTSKFYNSHKNFFDRNVGIDRLFDSIQKLLDL